VFMNTEREFFEKKKKRRRKKKFEFEQNHQASSRCQNLLFEKY
jgi:hypothetical protein